MMRLWSVRSRRLLRGSLFPEKIGNHDRLVRDSIEFFTVNVNGVVVQL